MPFYISICFKCLITPIYKLKCPIDQLQNDSLGKSNKRTLVKDFQFWVINSKKLLIPFLFLLWGLYDLLFMGLGQDQQQLPTVHMWGVSRGGGSMAVAFMHMP